MRCENNDNGGLIYEIGQSDKIPHNFGLTFWHTRKMKLSAKVIQSFFGPNLHN